VIFHFANEIVIDLEEQAIFQFAVLLVPRLNVDLAIECADLLHLGRDEVTLDEVVSDVQFVFFDSAALDTSGKIDGRQIQNGVLVRINVNLPARLVDRDNASDHYVANVWPIVASNWLDADDPVDVVDHSSHRGIDFLRAWGHKGSMPSNKPFAQEVSRDHDAQVSNTFVLTIHIFFNYNHKLH